MIDAVAEQVFIPLTVGGGVRKVDDVRRLLNAGADKVSINTSAVQNPQLVADASGRFGSQCIVVAIDAQRRQADDPSQGWEVYTHGGATSTGLDAVEWARRVTELGAGEILLTSMDRDGTKQGYDLELTRAVSDAVRSRDRLGRRRHAAASRRRRAEGTGRRGAGGVDLPLRRVHRRAGEGLHGAAGHTDAGGRMRAAGRTQPESRARSARTSK